MGFGDALRDKINDATGASAIGKALTPAPAPKAQTGDFVRPNSMTAGHVTSGLDQAMRDHADKMHPVGKPAKPVMGGDWDQ